MVLCAREPLSPPPTTQAIDALLSASDGDTSLSLHPALLAFVLRLFCAHSRRETPLALDLEAHPELKLEEAQRARLVALTMSCRGSEGASLHVFVGEGGWDAAGHLLLYPPPDEFLQRRVPVHEAGAESAPVVASYWHSLWLQIIGIGTSETDTAARRVVAELREAPVDPEEECNAAPACAFSLVPCVQTSFRTTARGQRRRHCD